MQTIAMLLLTAVLMYGCKNKNPNISREELVAELNRAEEKTDTINPGNDSIDNDTIVMDGRFIKTTPMLKDWKNYFLTNNRFKDWDEKDPRQVMVQYVVEKDGKASHVRLGTNASTGNEELDKEAIRLIEDATFTVGIGMNDKTIRTGRMAIVVYFPPKKK